MEYENILQGLCVVFGLRQLGRTQGRHFISAGHDFNSWCPSVCVLLWTMFPDSLSADLQHCAKVLGAFFKKKQNVAK